MPILFITYYLCLRYLPEYFDSHKLYWVLNSVLFLGMAIYVFNKSQKNVFNLFCSFSTLILFSYDLLSCLHSFLFISDGLNLINTFSKASIFFIIFILVFKSRYKWEKQKSHTYNPSKVQAIYSKPNDLFSLFGAVISLSPKCSVRYSYKGETLRFKKGIPNPIMTSTIIKPTDIIKDTDFRGRYFKNRYLYIKNKQYNLFTFNCKSLMK